jgi:NAD(P)-dependent dehydrogenase (short-subunit alcohol dehydrogenase family)
MPSTVLITGCSSGLGADLARAALDAGFQVIATARRPETLSDLVNKGAHAERLDVTQSPDELKQFARDVVSKYGQLDYLINNAGFLRGGALEETTQLVFRAC